MEKIKEAASIESVVELLSEAISLEKISKSDVDEAEALMNKLANSRVFTSQGDRITIGEVKRLSEIIEKSGKTEQESNQIVQELQLRYY